jgi:antitoxin component YwqK of YwqJK toxin-antitoxin module
MATAFMVRRALFLSSVFLFSACGGQIELQSFNADSLHLENRNGIAYNQGKPFSGSVFELNKTHDTIAVSGFYKGREHGEWKRFYPGGRLEELRYFDKGVKIKTLIRWWENGQKQLICSFRNGEYDGILKEWNESGQLTKEMHYKNGYEDGSQKMYYDNGKIRSNYVVKDGQRIGLLGTKNCVNVSDSVFKK